MAAGKDSVVKTRKEMRKEARLAKKKKKFDSWIQHHKAKKTMNNRRKEEKMQNNTLVAEVKDLKMLQLERMNTPARRAIFCIIMNAEDHIDASEKLLSLDLKGKQDREIVRVIVDCCLYEEVFNIYYSVLAAKICSRDKNHKFTLQYCIWDHYTQLESMQLIISMHLAKFVAEMVSDFTLSLAVLKKADLHDTTKFTSRKIMHFRMFFEAVFEHADSLVWNIFKRIAGSPQYETLRTGIKFFVESYVTRNQKQFAGKYKIAKKALKSVEQEEDPFL